MLFFDLEMYVSEEARLTKPKHGSMIYNPINPAHRLLGGYFISFDLKTQKIRRKKGIWLWNYANKEENLIKAIVELFQEEWGFQKKEKQKVLGKSITDLITCGIGIARIDLPVLFCRAQEMEIYPKSDLFDLFLKTKVIDLCNTASLLFTNERILYPKTANEIQFELNLDKPDKPSGKRVWQFYDEGEYHLIEERCEEEVLEIIQIYQRLQNRIVSN